MYSEHFHWGVAILLSSLLYGAMFMHKGARMGAEVSAVIPAPVITRLTFNQMKLNQETLPEIEPESFKSSSPPWSQPVKKTSQKPVVVKKVNLVEKDETNKPVKQVAAVPQSQGQLVSVSSEKIMQQKREQYLQKLLSHIESYKFYPRAARSRSIEGNVKISFILQDHGNYQQLELNGKPAVLVNAARMALEAAAPFPVPDDDIGFSRQIKFTMVYSLTL